MPRYTTYRSIYDQPSFTRPAKRRLHISMFRHSLAKVAVFLLVLSLTCTGVVTAFAASSDSGRPERELEQVVVLPGDTLWEIAVEHKPQGSDTRVYIKKLIRVNGLNSSEIKAGDILFIPLE
ncbi:LysM peptidoglycan-binding domain-containing protein [Paenibacillus macerans]|uniref:LysM peptidoglycan-binding domain-containing protein n=2 Tax=Paenibacillus macerans TaxID=44252 RepID=A0A6N8EUX4_PAEMA|nr:LysM peptidoglycan-binding domain-containing protein [Paenibacillus macerans]MUG23455.1 LysM peptidoglycan-binding domain-containing protein [Paenibacillus macerans]SUA83450.1 peptidoglycan-binding LysM [Paenibacillus macerans]